MAKKSKDETYSDWLAEIESIINHLDVDANDENNDDLRVIMTIAKVLAKVLNRLDDTDFENYKRFRELGVE